MNIENPSRKTMTVFIGEYLERSCIDVIYMEVLFSLVTTLFCPGELVLEAGEPHRVHFSTQIYCISFFSQTSIKVTGLGAFMTKP